MHGVEMMGLGPDVGAVVVLEDIGVVTEVELDVCEHAIAAFGRGVEEG